ncbi:MAG: selenocysteine-specific translation elongation factor [Candidatus Latescibacteria bacterium]|jgi:selenocysteine-specific elongation factor|nr:selenocysteine-specific translation elongation factor [Candidatus Latescibacterota bacterium]
MSHVIIGTAGHIDHGKTALVKALTDIETDTLPEEQARGVTIDIGFAYWKDNVTIIDVPGHERFVKNMVTGVCTVDLALFVVAADDGVMPQTREHLGILNLLGVSRGIVVLTKADLVEEEWLELVTEELSDLFEGTFLAGAPIMPVSSITGQGIEELRTLVEGTIEEITERPDRGIFRLPVDRVFSVQGFGTVVTGTVISGSVKPRDEIELLPSGKTVRVRGVQTHSKDVDVAFVGARAALNVNGVEVDEVTRGDILAETGYFKSTYMIDARLHLLPDAPSVVKNRTRVHLHLGPREVLARVILLEGDELLPGESQLVQLRLEEAGVAARGDRFVIRRYSPVQTLGGGAVLDPQPVKHRRFKDDVIAALKDLEQDDPTEVLGARLKATGLQVRTSNLLAAEMGLADADIEVRLKKLIDSSDVMTFTVSGRVYFAHQSNWVLLLEEVTRGLQKFHDANPLRQGARREELRALLDDMVAREFFEYGVTFLIEEGKVKGVDSLLGLSTHTISLSPEQEGIRGQILPLLQEGGTSPTDLKALPEVLGQDAKAVQDVVAAMQGMGDLVRMDDTLLFHLDVVAEVEEKLVAHFESASEIDVGTFRDLVGTTRKYAVPMLNYFDTKGTTIRQGDVRVLAK